MREIVPETVRSTIEKRDHRGVIRNGAEWLALWSDPESCKSDSEKRSDAEARRARMEVEQRLAAAARSISGIACLEIAFRPSSGDNLPALRGEVDSYALIRRFHSAEVDRHLAPADPSERPLFDLCESVRCEVLGARLFPGVRDNLVAHQLERLRRSDLINAHLASLVPLSEALRMVLRDALLDEQDASVPSSAFWMWHRWTRDRYMPELKALREALPDQSAYAPLAILFVRKLIREVGSEEARKRHFESSGKPSEEDGAEQEPGPGPEQLREDPKGELLRAGGDLAPEDKPLPLATGTARPYAVFTTAHDRVVRAGDLLDKASLRNTRAGLDRRRAEFRRDFARLVIRLQRRLLARQTRNWVFDLDEGLIDGSRLDRVIVHPGFACAYKQENESEFRDSIVSILIDNSGSMRGKPIEIACLASDMIAAALEKCGIRCEILGFTTSAWSGGNSLKDWVRAGKPPNPGRLNDLLHIIYKSADEPVRRSRTQIAAMLDPSLLRENIDGEALLWASRRLANRPEIRKILIVISDGAPADQATLEYNCDPGILDRHLRHAIASIENSRAMEVTAIGVKHNVSRYYGKSLQIHSVDDLGAALVAMVDRFLT